MDSTKSGEKARHHRYGAPPRSRDDPRALHVHRVVVRTEATALGRARVYVDGYMRFTLVKSLGWPWTRRWLMTDHQNGSSVAKLRVSRFWPNVRTLKGPKVRLQQPLAPLADLEFQVSDITGKMRWQEADRALVRIRDGQVHLPAIAQLSNLPHLESWKSPLNFAFTYRGSEDVEELRHIVATTFVTAWLWAMGPPITAARVELWARQRLVTLIFRLREAWKGSTHKSSTGAAREIGLPILTRASPNHNGYDSQRLPLNLLISWVESMNETCYQEANELTGGRTHSWVPLSDADTMYATAQSEATLNTLYMTANSL